MFTTLSISIAATLVSFAAGMFAQTAEPADSFKVDYFSGANSVVGGMPAPDGTVRITNVGTDTGVGDPSGDLFAVIYVFDSDQELTECCDCEITPDGLLTLSINNDLTSNPLTGHLLTRGVIKILGAAPSGKVAPGLRAWATHIQANGATTETAFSDATLSADEFNQLNQQCSSVIKEGSGTGRCGCGAPE